MKRLLRNKLVPPAYTLSTTASTITAAVPRAHYSLSNEGGKTPESAYPPIIDDDPNELGENFNFDDYIRHSEEKRRTTPPLRGSFEVKPSLSQAYGDRFQKNPYKMDNRLHPLFDYSKLHAFDPAHYPAIDVDHLYQPKKPRYEFVVKSLEDLKGRFEFRARLNSDMLMAASVRLQRKTPKHKQQELGQKQEGQLGKEGQPGQNQEEEQLEDMSYLVPQIFGWQNASKRELRKLKTQQTISRLQLHPSDTANPAIQVALITQRIQVLSEHLKKNRTDIPVRRNLQTLMQNRKRMLQYLRSYDAEMYWKTLNLLDMRVQI